MEKEEKLPPIHKRIVKNRAFFPTLFFLIAVLLFGFSSQLINRPPVIKYIAPEVGKPGEVLVITGDNFGETRQGGEVILAGERPTSDSYVEWSDEMISVRIPPDAGSGMVYVITRNGKSNGLLFTNREYIPVVVQGPSNPGQPYIENISPTKGNVGDMIVISGLNFGFDQGTVYFSSIFLSDETRQAGESLITEYIAASENDFDYANWNDREIQVRVPDGATSGNIFLVTDKGSSNSVYFEVTDHAGTKLLKQKRGYQISQNVYIDNVEAESGNSLYLWVPAIYNSLEQNNVESIYEPEPYWDNFTGVRVYNFTDLVPGMTHNISQTFWFDRYTVETHISTQNVPLKYDTSRKLFQVYTSPDYFIPSEEPVIGSISEALARGVRSPYQKAKNIYQYVLNRFTFKEDLETLNPIDAIEKREGDSYIYSVIFCALARKAGIPARPIAGFLVYGDKLIRRHFWAEFYLEGFGWVPVDPTLGDEVSFGDFPQIDNPGEYYFGNMDNQHIRFSRGIINTTQIKPQGRTVFKERMYSFQMIYEEAAGKLESYNSSWRDIRVIDWW
ncbi:MAG: transglutaminase [Spirochaetes bacterium]|nr:MAG: transglutaminase [Spirochaetota bacterium]